MNEDAYRRRDRVLVVDDSAETLSFISDALEADGITALVAMSGEAALSLTQQIVPDLVLMDGAMPGMDGFETTRRLRENIATAHLPVIFMTGLTDTKHIVQGLGAGAVDYIAKPIVLEVMLARLRVHLTNARLAYGARTALDATGRSLLAIDEAGRVLWSTPQAETMLAELFATGEKRQNDLPPTVIEKLEQLRRNVTPSTNAFVFDFGARRASFIYLSSVGPNEFLYRLVGEQDGSREAILREKFSLTAREAEVLVWIAAGKANRDISQILSISPRTVNKHLEQVFVKLGVENRATAAALAVRALTERS